MKKALALEVEMFKNAHIEPSTERAIRSTWAQYCRFCDSWLAGAQPAPVTYTKLAAFLALWCRRNRASGLSNKLYHIKKMVKASEFLPTDADVANFAMFRKGLAKFDNRKPEAKQALRTKHLMEIVDAKKKLGTWATTENNVQAASDWNMLLLQQQGMLRTAELIGDIKIKDVEINMDAATGRLYMVIDIHKSKMNKTGPAETIVFGEGDDKNKDLCVVTWTRRQLTLRGLDVRHADHQQEPLFVRWWTEGGKTTRAVAGWSGRLWVRRIRDLVALSSVNPKHVAGHSPRAGGATDALHSGEAPHLVMMQGRWKLYSSLLLYDRWTVEERAVSGARWVAAAASRG